MISRDVMPALLTYVTQYPVIVIFDSRQLGTATLAQATFNNNFMYFLLLSSFDQAL
ncbi:MAG: hypothetical protein NTX86_03290 [Candidatus Dependentiae bacterium]|nr:hypothetical protein [Candidatus Dependentiae bacterium]